MSDPKITYGDDVVTIELLKPIEAKKRTVKTISFRTECTVADLEEMDLAKGSVEQTKRMIAQLSDVDKDGNGLSLSTVAKMGSADYLACAAIIGKIIGGNAQADDEESDEDAEEAVQEKKDSSLSGAVS